MTVRIYWEDMYAREFDATVLRSEGKAVVLDRTAFNPRGGGLVSDTGEIAGVRVIEVVKEGDEIVHMVEDGPAIRQGSVVHAQLDWGRRYRIMRMHTAAHILSAVVNRETGALITGNQVAPDESRVDFDLGEFDRDKLSYYVEKVNEVVKRGLEVKAFFMKREEALRIPGLVKLASAAPPALDMLRIVQIGDVDTQADGGVHVRNTKEIEGVIALRVENKGRNNKRIYFTVP